MGLLVGGGMIISLSKAMKSASEKGESILDHFMGQFGAPATKIKNNMVVGNNNQVDSNKRNQVSNYGSGPAATGRQAGAVSAQYSKLKDLVMRNKLEECFQTMRQIFQSDGNKSALNSLINLSSQFNANEDRFNNGLIETNASNQEKNRIRKALLDLIDQEIEATP